MPRHLGGHMVSEVKKRFFGRLENSRELYLHRNHLPQVLQYMEGHGISGQRVSITYIDVPAAVRADMEVFARFVERDHQIAIVPELSDDVPSRKLDLYTGGGKLQPLDSPIKIPGGWSTMGEMEVGTIVTAWDGTPTKVTGVFPQGLNVVYEVECADGRKTRAGPEHLWKVFIANGQPGKRWRILNTVQLKWYVEREQSRTYIPLCVSEQIDDVDLVMDPYILGVILGDGSSSGSSLTVTKLDEDLFEELAARMPSGMVIKVRDHKTRAFVKGEDNTTGVNTLVRQLETLGLRGKRAWEKVIPDVYLNASHTQRLELLNGLLDTDGYVSAMDQPDSQRKSGSVSYSTTSYRLARGVQYLVRSIGGIAKITPKQKYFTYKGEKKEGRPAWQVNIRHPTPSILFKIARKKSRCADDGQYSEGLKLRVVSVEPVSAVETQCISIEHPDRLYITDDFIVTHNTFSALKACKNRAQRFSIMLAPKYFGLWTTALEDTLEGFTVDSGRYITVSGSKELKKVMEQAVDGLLTAEVIIISNTTYRNYIETYEKFGEAITDYGYAVPPQRFHELLGIGTQINDEFHEDLGLTFRIDVFTNVSKQIYLSATPYSGDEFVTKMVDVMLPEETHCTIPEPPKYINVLELQYHDDVQKADYLTPHKGSYNHARYETQMLKKKKRLNRYFDNVVKVVDKAFVSTYQPGQKMLILCATVDFIQHLTNYLRLKFPDVKIGHYVSGVPYETIAEQDITVSTIKSAGTGVDIRNLRETLLLQAVNSRKDNIQVLGRTRPLKDYPEVTPRLIFFTCLAIPQHIKYARNKKEVFFGRILNSRTMRL